MICIIVATDKKGVIGKEGGIPWYLPAELGYFKRTTMGYPIIMGRKTHESIGRTLPGRENIVITSDPSYQAAEGSIVVSSLDEAIVQAGDTEQVFIIGGESIYNQALPAAEKLYLTKVDADLPGDKFFHYDPDHWKLISSEKHLKDEKNPYDYEFLTLERVKA